MNGLLTPNFGYLISPSKKRQIEVRSLLWFVKRRGLRQARASKFSLKGQRFSLFLVIANSSAKVKLLDP